MLCQSNCYLGTQKKGGELEPGGLSPASLPVALIPPSLPMGSRKQQLSSSKPLCPSPDLRIPREGPGLVNGVELALICSVMFPGSSLETIMSY